ncbi:MAG: polyribonucleotide nucleotidyltransferase [Fibrobacteria bacterium]|nr:polyribonucleotide nucleotidyltransferase [Fibrobacteria bacterium]
MAYEKTEIEIAPGKVVTIETGKLAKQAAGSAVVSIGQTMVLVTVCEGRQSDGDFFPLTVEYREKAYAVGKFPGGYIKREARASEKEILTCRIIDRPIRPLFPKGFKKEVQVIATVINADGINDADSISVVGASVALGLSPIPFEEQVATVRVCRVNGEIIVNPSFNEILESDMEMIIAGSANSIVMVEGGAYEAPENEVVDAIMKGHEVIKKLIVAQNDLINKFGVEKPVYEAPKNDADLFAKVEEACLSQLKEALHTPMLKMAHYAAMDTIKESVHEALDESFPERESEINQYIAEIEKREMRNLILDEQVRIDGRKTDEVRGIDIETSLLPNCHGSAMFQRGETQALVVCTLGGKMDEQKVDSLHGDWYKNYYLHYNFPPYSVGETGRMFGPGRREIGHGHLAERSLEPVLPTAESFPYTIRLVSEILESHGSSSMASVCGGSLSLLDTGVPLKTAVSGIAMGLIYENDDRVQILSDINGTEDHLGDMDFKICGTKNGITGFQMDIKINGITPELMIKSLEQAKEGRLHILGKMNEALDKPRELSKTAPCIIKRQINANKIKDLIGPGGKVIRGIQETSGADLNVTDDGEITITAPQRGNANMALNLIDELFQEIEVDKQYKGKIKNITSFGVFVEALPGKEGLVHISELDVERGGKIEDVYSLGDEVAVKCISIDPQGRVRLSAKQADKE